MIRTIGVSSSWRNVLFLAAALTVAVPATSSAATPQTGFSPEGSARHLVLGVIDAAKHGIRMLG